MWWLGFGNFSNLNFWIWRCAFWISLDYTISYVRFQNVFLAFEWVPNSNLEISAVYGYCADPYVGYYCFLNRMPVKSFSLPTFKLYMLWNQYVTMYCFLRPISGCSRHTTRTPADADADPKTRFTINRNRKPHMVGTTLYSRHIGMEKPPD